MLNKNNMKKLIFLFFLLPLFLCAQTTTYYPFPYSNAIWTFQSSDMTSGYGGSCSGSNICYLTYQYRLDGDTIVLGQRYANIYRDVSFANCPCGPNSSQDTYTGYCGSIRNDTINKRVYFTRFSDPEQILYDFSLTVGDSFALCNSVISTVDSVLVGNNYRKRFITSQSFQFVEGIGNIGDEAGFGADLFWMLCSPSMSPYNNFICFTDTTGSYIVSPDDCVPLSNNSNELIHKFNVDVYPNPTTERFAIKFNDVQHNFNFKLLNVFGEEIQSTRFSGDEIVVETKGLIRGVYFIKIYNEKELLIYRKVIIE